MNKSFEIGDNRTLVVTITDEGVIMDVFDNNTNQLIETVGMMADEWADWIID
jgi:hypothetical protein